MRLRAGEGTRKIAQTGLACRQVVKEVKRKAQAAGWLVLCTEVPSQEQVAALFAEALVVKVPAQVPLAEPHRDHHREFARQCRANSSGTVAETTLTKSFFCITIEAMGHDRAYSGPGNRASAACTIWQRPATKTVFKETVTTMPKLYRYKTDKEAAESTRTHSLAHVEEVPEPADDVEPKATHKQIISLRLDAEDIALLKALAR